MPDSSSEIESDWTMYRNYRVVAGGNEARISILGDQFCA